VLSAQITKESVTPQKITAASEPAIVGPPTGDMPKERAYPVAAQTKEAVLAVTQPQSQTPVSAAVIREETLILPAYAYEEALIAAPGFPYPLLDKDRLGPARPKAYRAVILENDALRLTFLPELGGRLYQITDKATGRGVLYTNPVVKPTRWGPPEMTWWLAVGGMEWAFPVEEHGYAWAMTWDITAEKTAAGEAVARLRFRDKATGLAAEVTVVLPPQGGAFSVSPTLTNPGDKPATGQLWINTALPAGPGMRVEMPVETVEIHSFSPSEEEEMVVGDVMPWEPEMGEWGRWKWWFSVFTAQFSGHSHILQGSGGGPALQRDFDPQTAPGLKLFTWGPDVDVNEFEGQPYYEVWSGLTPNFETTITLNPGESQGWSEVWSVLNYSLPVDNLSR
jgi:hypothetical protein